MQIPTGLILWQPLGRCLDGGDPLEGEWLLIGKRMCLGFTQTWVQILALHCTTSAEPLQLCVPQLHTGMVPSLREGHE